MLGWGHLGWGLQPWGLGASSENLEIAPQIIYRSPLKDQTGVSENEVIQVQLFHPNYILDLETTQIYVQEALYYDGQFGFQAGAVGQVQTLSGITTIQFYVPQGFEFATRTHIRVRARDTAGAVLDETWSFQVREDPACYAGFQVLPVEIALQRPLQTFLTLEHTRDLLLNMALRKTGSAIRNEGNKAARVVYQLAFATELSTLQNPYRLKNVQALDAIVCEKENTLEIDRKIAPYRDRIIQGVDGFRSNGLLGEDYVRSFHEYLESSNYLYRTSLMANMVLYAAAYELNAQSHGY